MLFNDADIIRLDTVDSTNNYAANLLKLSLVPEGTVITALEQKQGRGQRGAIWNSSKGENLLCSIILYPKSLKPNAQFLLCQTIALAVQEFIEETSQKDTYIKWPNDLIVGGKKVAGILIENNWNDSKIQNSIVGIGININQRNFSDRNAQSLVNISGEYFALEECVLNLRAYIEKYYLRMCKGHDAFIRESYHNLLYNLNKPATYLYSGERISAVVLGVGLEGRLLLRCSDGREILCDFKEISLINNGTELL